MVNNNFVASFTHERIYFPKMVTSKLNHPKKIKVTYDKMQKILTVKPIFNDDEEWSSKMTYTKSKHGSSFRTARLFKSIYFDIHDILKETRSTVIPVKWDDENQVLLIELHKLIAKSNGGQFSIVQKVSAEDE